MAEVEAKAPGRTNKLRGSDVRRMTKDWDNTKPIYAFEDGWGIYELEGDDVLREGRWMGHCLNPVMIDRRYRRAFSLRRPNGTPHCTMLFLNKAGQKRVADEHGISAASSRSYSYNCPGYGSLFVPYDRGENNYFTKPMPLDGEVWHCITASGRGGSVKDNYVARVVEWYKANGGEGDCLLGQPYHYYNADPQGDVGAEGFADRHWPTIAAAHPLPPVKEKE